MNDDDVRGATVLITGGTRGIGAGIARRFVLAGANVVVCGRREPAVAADGRAATFIAADVRDPAQVDRLITTAVEATGRLDVVVNNAGGTPYTPAATTSPDLHQKIVQLNLIAPLHVSQRAYQVMQAQDGGGSIIMIGSVSGVRPSPGSAAYGAAKAGLHHLTACLAVEWAPKVRVNNVIIGLAETELAHLHYGDAAGVAAVAATVPLGRMATPDDVAEACLFLASSRSGYMSGASLLLHGGGELPQFLSASNVEHPGQGPTSSRP
jgi:NAD(P)-dependent dehydrogenase (short-subunit alcohol dehydrogenase family)